MRRRTDPFDMSLLRREVSDASKAATNMLVYRILTSTDHLLEDARAIVLRDAPFLPEVLHEVEERLAKMPQRMRVSYVVFDTLLAHARRKRLRASF